MHDLPDQFEITAHPQNAGAARERVLQAAVRAGFAGMDLADIEISVGEAVTNAILYGSPNPDCRVLLSFGRTDAGFVIQVRDEGAGFDPSLVRAEEDTDALGGRGIRLMRALMDQVDLHYNGHGMTAVLVKKMPAKSVQAQAANE